MITSLRLKGSLGIAIVLALGTVPVPDIANGQTDNRSSMMATGETPESIARKALLSARQSLAIGDVESAKHQLGIASKSGADFRNVGDSIDVVNTMIDRQLSLLKLFEAKDSTFDAQAATFLLIQADAMIQYQDFKTAEMLIKQAGEFQVEFTPTTGTPQQMMEKLLSAKNSLSSASATQNAKKQVLSLLAQAQLAMDQQRWLDAQDLVKQAKLLNVDESLFTAAEPRVWQAELKIQNALSRNGGQTSVAQATLSSDRKSTDVVQAGYDPSTDKTKVVQVAAMMDADGNNVQNLPKSGMEYYNAGLNALMANDRAAAIDNFQRAWLNREGLDGNVRMAIKSQLEKLAPDSEVLKATLASQETEIKLDQVKAEQRKAFSELQAEIFKERTAVDSLLKTRPREALTRMQSIRAKVAQSSLDSESQRPLLAIIDRDITEMQKYIDQNLPEIINDEANANARELVEQSQQRRLDVEMQLQKLVEQYNKLIKEERFAEAGVIVKQARELSPNSEIVAVLEEKYRAQANMEAALAIKEAKEESNIKLLNEAAAVGAAQVTTESPMAMTGDLELWTRNKEKRTKALEASRYNSPAEARIYNLLENETVQGEFRGSLPDVMAQLSQQVSLNIVFDNLALEAENVASDKQVSVNLVQPISVKSCLDLLLQQCNLVYVVENEVVKITSKESQNSKLDTKTYYIGDLIMPMGRNPDPLRLRFLQPNNQNLAGGSFNVPADNRVPNLVELQQMNQGGYYRGPQTGTPTYATQQTEGFGGITEADFDALIQLITNTIDSAKWSQNGGPFSIRSFPANLSLIVASTQEVHDQLQALFKQLRALNDVQIVIEVRFLTLNDQFFEKIGIDFDFSINDYTARSPIDANGRRVDSVGGTRVVGRNINDGVENFATDDFDLRFTQGSFAAASPQFGGSAFSPSAAGNFGFAILSDIEVFFLIQAAKGDTRSMVTQAPTVTMFNGQGATIFDGAQRPFVTSVVPVVGDFAVAHQPIITMIPDGTNLNVQAVASADRRFVQLNLVPVFTKISEVSTFTFDGSTTTRRTSESILDDLLNQINPNRPNNPNNEDFETETQGITIQLPVVAQTTISTVVSVPDGGTVLLGGVKRMQEGRTEQGLPFLSNIPYVNRLFRNTAIGHSTSNLMMMVTPRIIIQEEIEEDTMGTSKN